MAFREVLTVTANLATSRPGVATRTSTALRPPATVVAAGQPAALIGSPRSSSAPPRGGPNSASRSRANAEPSCPTARPSRSGVSWTSASKTRATCAASPRVGSSTSARSRGSTRGSSCCTTGSAYASVLPEPVGAQTQTSPHKPDAWLARASGTTLACTGKQRLTPIRWSAASSRASSRRDCTRRFGVLPMIVAFARCIHSGSSPSSHASCVPLGARRARRHRQSPPSPAHCYSRGDPQSRVSRLQVAGRGQ